VTDSGSTWLVASGREKEDGAAEAKKSRPTQAVKFGGPAGLLFKEATGRVNPNLHSRPVVSLVPLRV
jgi:hypothetical protein